VSALLNDTTRSLGHTAGATPLTTGVAIVIMTLLVVLLIQREVARPVLSGERAKRAERLGFVLWPLGIVLLAIIASRVHHLLLR
jgi:hypothetical protein